MIKGISNTILTKRANEVITDLVYAFYSEQESDINWLLGYLACMDDMGKEVQELKVYDCRTLHEIYAYFEKGYELYVSASSIDAEQYLIANDLGFEE